MSTRHKLGHLNLFFRDSACFTVYGQQIKNGLSRVFDKKIWSRFVSFLNDYGRKLAHMRPT